MNKPITVAKKDFETSIIELINNSGLPAFVIRYVLTDIQILVSQEEKKQLEDDKQRWDNVLQEEKDVYSDGNTNE